jgi:peptide deformylase
MLLTVVKYPAKVLSKPARRIKPGSMDLRTFERDMIETMKEEDGIGLAAPQVGEGVRFLVAHDSKAGVTRSFVNPQITWAGDEEQIGTEGCLSFPGLLGEVWRFTTIRVKYQDLDFNTHEEEFEGFYARVLQHEIDHLNGVLLNERAEGELLTQEEFEEKLRKENASKAPAETSEVAD